MDPAHGCRLASVVALKASGGQVLDMFKFKTLQRRFFFLLLIPITLFLVGFGVSGYFLIKNLLFQEWRQVATLRLERAAGQVDKRLDTIKMWLQAFARAGQAPHARALQDWVLAQLRAQPGVSQVNITWLEPTAAPKSFNLSPITYTYPPGEENTALAAAILDRRGEPIGRIEVLMSYKYLLQDILGEGWLQTQMACLVNDQGIYLAHSNPAMRARHCLGETGSPLEKEMLQAMQGGKKYDTLVQKGYFPEHVIGYYKLEAAPWVIMLHARGSQILAPILRFRLLYLAGLILMVLVILALIRLALQPVLQAIHEMAAKAETVARGDYGDPLPVTGFDEISQLARSFNRMVTGLQERDFISSTFGRYVDPEIARELLSRPEASRLGGEKRQVVILFSDIRGFTPLAESLSPEAVIQLVNRHFSHMIEIIQAHRGIIVDFLGDAILAFFDPLEGPLEPAVGRALASALQMQAAVKAENLANPSSPAVQIGIGLHAGEVIVGNIGSPQRAKYGIIGSPVNLTHRIQGQARAGEVLISEAILRHSPELLSIHRSFATHLKGIAHPVILYAVAGLRPGTLSGNNSA
jgi:adenylate cyclase